MDNLDTLYAQVLDLERTQSALLQQITRLRVAIIHQAPFQTGQVVAYNDRPDRRYVIVDVDWDHNELLNGVVFRYRLAPVLRGNKLGQYNRVERTLPPDKVILLGPSLEGLE